MKRLFPVVLLLSLFTCCLPFTHSSAWAKEVFRYRLATDPPTLDPARSTDTTSGCVVLKIFDGLVEFDPKTLEIVPAVAEKYEISEDGLTLIFHLRKGVKFHNGREVTAEDFRYSFERLLTPATLSERAYLLFPVKGAEDFYQGKAKSIEGLKVLDSMTLSLTLSRPYAPFLNHLAMEACSAVPKEEVGKWGKEFMTHPVGCGPWKFLEWKRDVRLVLAANKDYYQGAPFIDEIEFKVLTNVTTALEEYKAGKLDLLDEIPPNQHTLIASSFPTEYKKWPILSIYYIGIHEEKEPFKGNKKLRQALNYAVDKETICKVLREGVPEPANGILPPGVPGYDPDRKAYPYNPEKAQELLKEAGYPGGRGLPEVTLWYNNNETHKQIGEFIQANLMEIGVRVKLKTLEWATYLDACRRGEPELYRLGWVADYPDADNFLWFILDSSRIPDPNYERYHNPEFDELVRKAQGLYDMNERIKLYREAENIAVDDACWIFVYFDRDTALVKAQWDGLVLPKQGDFTIPVERLKRK